MRPIKKIVRSEGHEVSTLSHKDDTYYEVVKSLDDDEQFYGLGDKTGYLNKRGYEYDNWNYDEPRPHIESFTHLYKSIPVMFGLKNGHPYGLFFLTILIVVILIWARKVLITITILL